MISANSQPILSISGLYLPAEQIERRRESAVKVQIAVEHGDWGRAHAAIDAAQRADIGVGAPARGKTTRPLDTWLTELGLDMRCANALAEVGIYTVEHLLDADRQDLERIPNMGPKTIRRCFGLCEAFLGRPAGKPYVPSKVLERLERAEAKR